MILPIKVLSGYHKSAKQWKNSRKISTAKNKLVLMMVLCATLAVVNVVRAQPTADFDAEPMTGYAPLTVVFTDKSINAVKWTWYFPSAIPFSLTGAGPHSVLYPNEGTYEATLEVMDVTGFTDSKSKTITVVKPAWDFGDAPDDQMHHYRTLIANNGARHHISDQIYLGAGVDEESDGQQNGDATGDDLNDDDEDGVTIPALITGQTVNIEITAHGTGWLHTFIDFNGDGDWDDTLEALYLQQLTEGINTLPVHVPEDAVIGKSFARFRFTSDDSGINYFGPANDGEVEDYEVTIEAYDFGDAPDPTYPTLLANNGARHMTVRFPKLLFLGNSRDNDPDGQPDATANGDDNDGNDDEDGITFFNIIFGYPVISQGLHSFSVFTCTSGGYLNAWMDFNRDGDWNDPNEQVAQDAPILGNVLHLKNFNVPFIENPGYVFSRFRFSTLQGLQPEGPAPDGEVEDYVLVATARDYGDAPDPPYPTLHVNDGARHTMGNPLGLYNWLGTELDSDPDGQPDVNALGDDMDGNDDDDGVLFTSPLIAGNQVSVTVTAGLAGILNAWIDFCGNGVWGNVSAEKIFNNEDLASGENYLTFNVPASATPKTSWARFRFSNQSDLFPNGCALNGEVEDYEVSIYDTTKSLDYGDAPDPIYPTLIANGGAGHILSTTLYLGNLFDGELDGQPDPNALGDDQNGLDDDDGATFITPLVPGNTATLRIISTQGFLNGWVDFNGDGDWDDPGEKILVGVGLMPGTHYLVFNVPLGATTGSTFARFRFSSVANLTPIGIAPDGEVEDYQVTIEELVEGAIKWFQPPLKDIKSPYPYAFWGWDEVSIYGQQIIADDWFCHDARPVTHIHWWGSYAEWDSTVPPPKAPSNFHIGIWTDVPKSDTQSWSHPGQMIREWEVERSQLNECVAGSDYFENQMAKPDTCFRYDFTIPQGEWFYQEGDSTVYWLTISVIYDTIPDLYQWGWKTRDRYFNDDAVRIITPASPEPDSEFQTGEVVTGGWDMCFMLTTTEYYDAFDFGDAPDPLYPTMFASNGAHHIIRPGQHLGSGIDAEDDGKQDISAMGDDIDGTDDEDGIVFLTGLMQGETATIQVTASVDGFINGWIDFNGNGDWDGPDEHIFTDGVVLSGENVLSFDVPAAAISAKTFARFRFSLTKGVTHKGLVVGGEVEDYEVSVATEVEEASDANPIPSEFMLFQNSPNPFNPTTEIRYQLPTEGLVRLTVYNLAGQEVRILVDELKSPGIHSAVWNARDDAGREVPAGIYVYRFEAGRFSDTKKLLLIK